MYLKSIKLTDGNLQIVPETLELINPSREGNAEYLYLVWIYDPTDESKPSGFNETARGRGLCHPFGYLTDHIDLYKTGRHDTPMSRSELMAVLPDFIELTNSMLKAARRELPDGEIWAFAFCPCDCTGAEVPIGTSEAFCYTGGLHE